jgi:propionyl-CoA carboxylase beta chain
VITPHATRLRLARALVMLKNKRLEMPSRKHDNLPVRGWPARKHGNLPV